MNTTPPIIQVTLTKAQIESSSAPRKTWTPPAVKPVGKLKTLVQQASVF